MGTTPTYIYSTDGTGCTYRYRVIGRYADGTLRTTARGRIHVIPCAGCDGHNA